MPTKLASMPPFYPPPTEAELAASREAQRARPPVIAEETAASRRLRLRLTYEQGCRLTAICDREGITQAEALERFEAEVLS